MPIAVALLAGAPGHAEPLWVCAAARLPGVLCGRGASDNTLPHAPTRVLQAILAGLTATTGFLSVFGVVGVPAALGAGQLADTIPWVGFAVGVAMALVASATLAGRQVLLAVPTGRVRAAGRRPAAILLYGVGYGLASLGCTLPVFLVVIGASLATNGPLAALGVFGAYALGMAVVLMALSIGAGLLRDGLARALGRAIPHLRWINGGLLLPVSAYLVDYWGSVLFASADSRAGDPLVGFVQRSTTLVQSWVTTLGGRWLLAGPAAVVALTALVALWQWTLRPENAPDEDRRAAEQAPSRTGASTIAGD